MICPHCLLLHHIAKRPDRLVKLRHVERQLDVLMPRRPSRNTLINWLNDGTLRGIQLGRGHNYYVFESSLDSFKQKLSAESIRYAA